MNDVGSGVIKSNRIVFPDGIKSGYLQIQEGKICGFAPHCASHYIDHSEQIIMPGFVDIHVHGWGRGSFAYKGNQSSLKWMSHDLVKAGVTAYLPTSGTMPNDFLEASLVAAADFIATATAADGAEAIGIHMEGPYISEKHLGMQRADCLQRPSIASFERFNQLAGHHIRLMTLAPELEGALEVIRHLHAQGITVSAGHTDATFAEITAAIEAGLNHFTHAYSGMRGFHHRELGVVGALMYYQDTYAEVAKQSGITIKPEAFDLLYRLKRDRRMVLMSDCMGYVDFPEGYEFYHYLRKETFRIKQGQLEIAADGGDTRQVCPCDYQTVKHLEMNFLDSVKNIVGRLDHGLVSVARIACENPALLAGAADRKGSLSPGKDADILVLDDDLNLLDVYCRGRRQQQLFEE
ncbi:MULTISPECIES: N-acetylglucosamine-6-phosphate deacetylase [unclassified Symbiopectobacterium]|uniref:N-acetylglucosamine-6-phosphate deacetylase n=1 Tax=unclassified Symbiopectobacterium TaxID=2794573 RepID=UPI002225F14B|nr:MULTISPECIES: N-acetylglucosamine-6-phosphate deacetylase [unclassified Symbiopectobacterium]MCW2475979.1 N-acetylglucosamine-6-phosphate deacetylase [Candidatus Symbiopectobacterium sp. NZEC151]MCW2482841.1 N-acetylglucosamine-6-phosphate deacetylase [Candidatus Symbiopectobacterium sp. NZEC135]MCW2485806.1 N-acetylglucosamine-6-phosphate deacetylase [Candidatus Symbiopectobacterium sp. NZEC127]